MNTHSNEWHFRFDSSLTGDSTTPTFASVNVAHSYVSRLIFVLVFGFLAFPRHFASIILLVQARMVLDNDGFFWILMALALSHAPAPAPRTFRSDVNIRLGTKFMNFFNQIHFLVQTSVGSLKMLKTQRAICKNKLFPKYLPTIFSPSRYLVRNTRELRSVLGRRWK